MKKLLKYALLIGMTLLWFNLAGTIGLAATEEWIEVGECTITHYCSCSRCCGKWGATTSSGAVPTRYRTAAVAEDTGVSGHWVDVYTEGHQHALDLGLKHRKVWIIKEVEDGG